MHCPDPRRPPGPRDLAIKVSLRRPSSSVPNSFRVLLARKQGGILVGAGTRAASSVNRTQKDGHMSRSIVPVPMNRNANAVLGTGTPG